MSSGAVDGHGGTASVRVDETLVGAALARFAETERGQDGDDLARSEGTGRAGMVAQTRTVWVPMNSPLDRRLTVLQDKGNDFGEVGVEFVQRRTLAVGASEAGT